MSSGGDVLKSYFKFGQPKIASYYFNPCNPKLVNCSQNISQQKCQPPILFSGRPYGLAQKERVETINYLNKRDDVLFIGGAQYINYYKSSNVKNWLMKKLTKNKHNRLRGDEYIHAIQSSKIGVGVSAYQNINKYSSDRLSHFVSFGGFYLAHYFPGLYELFDESEIVSFKNIDELDYNISYFLNNTEERKYIAGQAQKRMLEEYNSQKMTRMMLDIMTKGFSDIYPWIETYKK